ncbi:MAG: hypothetical protein V1897_05850 [Pseudomonadota bacterium]
MDPILFRFGLVTSLHGVRSERTYGGLAALIPKDPRHGGVTESERDDVWDHGPLIVIEGS